MKENIADAVAVMYRGKLVEYGDIRSIYEDPKHPYTKGLLACRPPLNKRYTFLPTVSDFMQIDDSGNIIDNNISVEEFTKDLSIPDSDRKTKQEQLFAQEPILKIQNFFHENYLII